MINMEAMMSKMEKILYKNDDESSEGRTFIPVPPKAESHTTGVEYSVPSYSSNSNKRRKNSEENSTDDDDTDNEYISSFKKMKKSLCQMFPDSFVNKTPTSARSVLIRTEGKLATTPDLQWSDGVLSHKEIIEEKLKKKRESSTSKNPLISYFIKKGRGKAYQVEETPTLGLTASSKADFSSLVAPSRRSSIKSTKVSWTQSESTSLIQALHKTLELNSFAEWSVALLANQLKELDKSLPIDERNKTQEMLENLRILDRTISDSIGQSSSCFANAILKKRDAFCNILLPQISESQRISLLFADLNKDTLFNADTIQQISEETQRKVSTDFMTKTSSSSTSKKPRSPLDAPRFRGSSFRANRPSRGAKNRRGSRRTNPPRPAKK